MLLVSMAIRDPAPSSQYMSTVTVDKSFFQEHDSLHVQAKYPKAPEYLTKRLGCAISSRRQYLSYREAHQQKLSKGIEKVGFEELGTGQCSIIFRTSTVNRTQSTQVTVQRPQQRLNLIVNPA
jgi:hypothetical protein